MEKKIMQFYVITFVFMTFFLGVVHEMGHILCCCLIGGKTIEVGMINLTSLYTKNIYPNRISRGIGALAGTLFNCILISLLFILIKIIKKGEKLYLGLNLILVGESLNWIVSCIMQQGDAYNFASVFGINLLIILTISLICLIGFFILSLKILFKTLDIIGGIK